jgi:arginine decarboxylase
MSKDAKAAKHIDRFFSDPGGGGPPSRPLGELVEAAKVWAQGGHRAKYDAAQ